MFFVSILTCCKLTKKVNVMSDQYMNSHRSVIGKEILSVEVDVGLSLFRKELLFKNSTNFSYYYYFGGDFFAIL